VHLLYHFKVVDTDGSNSLDHTLAIAVAAFLLEVFYLLPEILWDFCRGGRSMVCLGETKLLQEFLLVGLNLLLTLKHLVYHLL